MYNTTRHDTKQHDRIQHNLQLLCLTLDTFTNIYIYIYIYIYNIRQVLCVPLDTFSSIARLNGFHGTPASGILTPASTVKLQARMPQQAATSRNKPQ